MTAKSALARELIKEVGPRSKKGLASLLLEKHPKQFKNIEDARSTIRYVTGSYGNQNRDYIKDKSLQKFFYSGFEDWASKNLNSELRPWDSPYVIPSGLNTLNIIADLHSVHMDASVMTKFLKSTQDKTALLINGDLLDSESLSRHLKLHNVVEYEKELEICKQILIGLKQEFNHVYFKAGNHDFWLERYLLTNAREIFRLKGLEIETLLELNNLNVHYIHNLKYIQYGDLDIIHGHEFHSGFGAGKFPAGGFVDKWQTFKGKYDVKILASHCHRQDVHMSRRSKDGKYGQGWVTPAFCRKSAQYNPYAGWDNGWAVAKKIDGVVDVELTVI
jgi:hypothetical protein